MELICEDLCELIGIIIGDGCLSNASKRHTIEITGSPKEQNYLKNHVCHLLSKFSGKQPKVLLRERALRIRIESKAFFTYLTTKIGLAYGRDKSKIVFIPDLILRKGWNYIKYTLRGIVDTDGSVFTSDKPGSPNYPSIEITTISKELAYQLFQILKNREFRVTIRNHKPKNGERTFKIGLNGYEMLEKWKREISFSNSKKISKCTSILEKWDRGDLNTRPRGLQLRRDNLVRSPGLSYCPDNYFIMNKLL